MLRATISDVTGPCAGTLPAFIDIVYDDLLGFWVGNVGEMDLELKCNGAGVAGWSLSSIYFAAPITAEESTCEPHLVWRNILFTGGVCFGTIATIIIGVP